MTKEEILYFLNKNKKIFRKKFGIKKIALFGSYAKNLANKNSDIDILIEMEKKDFFLKEDFRFFLEKNLQKKVDICYFDSIREFFKEKIKKEAIYV